ncbi:MAG: hypothetical protein JO335_08775 [Sphingomonas sp.]|nr:hypothetical protein [Sphingomonas sp.]
MFRRTCGLTSPAPCFLALFLIRGRRATIVLLATQILLFVVPYWQSGAAERLWLRTLGY